MQVVKGRSQQPARIIIYGPPGCGKSTFACSANRQPRPEVLALDYESGLEEIGVDRVRGATNWNDSLKLIKEACSTPSHSTLVIDTVDKLEEQATAHVCAIGSKGKPMPDLGAFGYGDGYEALLAQWRVMLSLLETARDHGKEVILVAHVQAKVIEDPVIGNYSKLIAQLSKRSWGATHRWADAVLFANYEQGLVDGRAIMTGNRLLHTQSGTGFDAKNRWGLPPSLPLSWAAFEEARKASQRLPEAIRAAIRALTTEETKSKAEVYMAEAGDDVQRLNSIEKALKAKVTA